MVFSNKSWFSGGLENLESQEIFRNNQGILQAAFNGGQLTVTFVVSTSNLPVFFENISKELLRKRYFWTEFSTKEWSICFAVKTESA